MPEFAQKSADVINQTLDKAMDGQTLISLVRVKYEMIHDGYNLNLLKILQKIDIQNKCNRQTNGWTDLNKSCWLEI